MYICLCNKITDKQVMQAVSDGAKTASGVYKAYGCAPQCGKCACYIEDLITPNVSPNASSALSFDASFGGGSCGALLKAADI